MDNPVCHFLQLFCCCSRPDRMADEAFRPFSPIFPGCRTVNRRLTTTQSGQNSDKQRKRSRTGVRRGFLTMRSENQTSRMYRLIRNRSLPYMVTNTHPEYKRTLCFVSPDILMFSHFHSSFTIILHNRSVSITLVTQVKWRIKN